MFSSIPAVRDELKARLTAALPSSWAVVNNIEAQDQTLTQAVYLEFIGLSTTFLGAPLAHGILGAEVQVIITDPRTSTDGEAGVEDHLVPLLAALDEHPDLHWAAAVKQKVDRSGLWAWTLTITAFVNNTTTTEE